MGQGEGFFTWAGRECWGDRKRQPAFYERGDLDCAERCAVEGFAGALWKLEQRLATISEMGPKRSMGAGFSRVVSGCGLGRAFDRFNRGQSASARSRGSKKNGQAQEEGIGRSRGGLTSKIHAVVDALGNPVDFLITGGQMADVTQAEALLADKEATYLIGDKGYDSDELIQRARRMGMESVIPPRSNRRVLREYDKHLYKDRNLIERFFNKIKHFRRIATRYEKTSLSYLSMVYLAASLILLK